MKTLFLSLVSFFICQACGVKGQPVPPEKPREIGIGKPQYKGVDLDIKKNKKEDEDKK